MRWRILGPVEVVAGDRVLPIERPQQRGVLGYLLLNANRTVPTEQLIDALWDGEPPVSARTQIHACVSRIRRVLTAGGADAALVSDAAGYRIVVEDGQSDVAEFVELVARARIAAADRDPGAVELLRAGLALWRGPALTGAAGAYVTAATAALDEQRLAAYEELADAEMTAGRYHGLVAELRPLVDAYPLREHLVGRLMLALAGSGQQAGALELYRETRSRLVDEFGIEPGAELSSLHQRILRQEIAATVSVQDPAIPASPVGPGRHMPVVPAQLPPDIATFVGRTADLRRLDGLLPAGDGESQPVVIAAIVGTAGIGKTALAVHWAHRVAHRFPDGQLYVNLRGFDPGAEPSCPADAVRDFLDALAARERTPMGLDAQVALYRSLLAGRRMLVVLDNAHNAEQVRPLLPGSPGCLVVVTSRDDLSGLIAAEGARPITLDLFEYGEAQQLLASRVGLRRVAAEPRAADQIISLCARLPLALSIVAARTVTHPTHSLATLAAELREAGDSLDLFGTGDARTDVRAAFSCSYNALSTDGARLFRLLGSHPGPDIGAPAAASLAGIPPRRLGPMLAELTRAHLIIEHSRGRYGLHDLLRAYGAELTRRIDTPEDRHAARGRLIGHYRHTAAVAAHLLNPGAESLPATPLDPGVTPVDLADHTQALAWFVTERPALLAAIGLAVDAGLDADAWHLTWAITNFLHLHGYWREIIETQHIALDLLGRLGDERGTARAHRFLARAYARLGRYRDGRHYYRQALAGAEQIGDLVAQAQAHVGLSFVDLKQGNHHRALHHAQRADGLFVHADNQPGRVTVLNTTAWLRVQLGEFQQALADGLKALELSQQVRDVVHEAAVWDTLGQTHRQLGNHRDAVACYLRAVHLYDQLGDRLNQADTLTNLGDLHHAAADTSAAYDTWRQALTMLRDLDHHDAERVRARLATAASAGLAPPSPGTGQFIPGNPGYGRGGGGRRDVTDQAITFPGTADYRGVHPALRAHQVEP